MHPPDLDGDVRVEFHVRGELPPPAENQSQHVYDHLSVLAEQGAIDAVERTRWVSRTPIESADRSLRDAYLAFQDWATAHDVVLEPFFQIREGYSTTGGERTDWLVLPAMCLALYTDDSLCAVYPHTDGPESYTVQEGVEALRQALLDGTDPSKASAD